MRRRVVWAQAARDDYLAAIRFIARDDPDAALRVAEKIEAAGDALAAFTTGRPGRVHGTYEKVVSGLPYIMAYEIIATQKGGGEIVAILRVIHGARDWPPQQWPAG